MNDDLRPGKIVADALPPEQAGLVFIGRTPWTERGACPRCYRKTCPAATRTDLAHARDQGAHYASN